MVVAGEVEQSVDDQMGGVGAERYALFFRLARADPKGQDDVPEHPFVALVGGGAEHILAAHHREREHVGRRVLGPPLLVERLDLGIVAAYEGANA